MIRRSLLLAAGLLALVPASGQAAPPNPFGHACVPQDGVLFGAVADVVEAIVRNAERALAGWGAFPWQMAR